MGTYYCRYGHTFLALLLLLTPCMAPAAEHGEMAATQVMLDTSMGPITLELYPDKAPQTVENFLHYVDAGFFNGLLFHRVIPKFMIQGGGFEPGMKQKKHDRPPVRNEADNGLQNERGTVAMARTGDPHSASSQFFINLVDNSFLNHSGKQNGQAWGYAVFGRVIEGMETVDAIAGVATGKVGPFADVPLADVTINAARRADTPAPPATE